MKKNLAAATILVAALTVVAALQAHAATPKPGTFVWQGRAGGEIVSSVNLTVNGDSTKITGLFAQTIACGSPLSTTKKIKIKGSGRFKYDGKASNPLGDEGTLEVKGRFTKPKLAKGTAQLGGCQEKLRFKAKYGGSKG